MYTLIERSLSTIVSFNHTTTGLNDTDSLILIECIQLTSLFFPYFIYPLGILTNLLQIIFYSHSRGFRSSVMRLYLRRMAFVCMFIQTIQLLVYLDLRVSPRVQSILRFAFNIVTALYSWLLVVLVYAILDCFSACNLTRAATWNTKKKNTTRLRMFRKKSSTIQVIQNSFAVFRTLYSKVICLILLFLVLFYSLNLLIVEANLNYVWSYLVDFLCVYFLPFVFITNKARHIVKNIRAKSRMQNNSIRGGDMSSPRRIVSLQRRFLLIPVIFSMFMLPYFMLLLAHFLLAQPVPSYTETGFSELKLKLALTLAINWQLCQYSLLLVVPLSFDRIFKKKLFGFFI
jgi:hypothetical protein